MNRPGWGRLVAAGAILLLLGSKALAQNPPPARTAIQDDGGLGVEGAIVQVLRMPQAGEIHPRAKVLARLRTSGDGTLERSLPSVRGMIIVVDHPRYERFVGTYDDGQPPSVIRLAPGRFLEGKVLSADGNETAGATVCVRWEDEESPPPVEVVRRCSDASDDGQFVVAGLSEFAEAEVVAEAEGYGRATTGVSGSRWPEHPLSLRLDAAQAFEDEASTAAAATGSIRVQVLSASGNPVDRFTMRVLIRRARSHRESIWNAEQTDVPVVVPIPGNAVGGDVLQIRFQAENHLLSEVYRLFPSPGRVTDLGVVYLDPGAIVSGRLFDTVGSQPVAGCLLELVPAGSGRILHRLRSRQHLTTSDGEGAFLLGGLVEGRYYLRTECRTGPPTVRLIVLDAAEHADLGEIWMPATRTVRVRVRGANSGVIHVMDRFREVEVPLATAVLRPGAGVAEREPVPEDRDPVSSAEVRLAPGRYRIDLRDSANGLLVSKEIRVEANGTADLTVVDLQYQQRTIRSTLTLAGRPVNGGLVRFERIPGSRAAAGAIQIDSKWRGTTNTTLFRPSSASVHEAQVAADGSFVVEDAPYEYLWMTWFAADGQSRVGRIWPDQPLSQLDLGGVHVAGELRQTAGLPLREADVVLIGDLGLEVAAAYSTEDGRFMLPPAPPGQYRLLANTGTGLAKSELSLNADEPPAFQVLQTDEDGAGTVEVHLASSGGPLVGAWMHVLGPDETLAATRLVVEDGAFEAEDVPAGEVTVLWNHGGACVGADKVTLEPGRSARLDRTLRLGRLLELRCSDRSCAGETLSLVRLTTETGVKVAHHLTGALPGTTFSDDGRVGLGCLTPGAYTVSLWADERRWDADFELDPGPEETPVTVTVRPSAG